MTKQSPGILLRVEKSRYLHGVSKQIQLCFITITLLRVTAEILYNEIKRYGSLRVQGKNRNIISLEDCHRVLFIFLDGKCLTEIMFLGVLSHLCSKIIKETSFLMILSKIKMFQLSWKYFFFSTGIFIICPFIINKTVC